MNNTTTADIVAVNSFYNRDLLYRAQATLLHTKFAATKNIPQGNSSTIVFRRYANFPAASTPLVEGVTPVGRKLSAVNVTATVQQYGDYVTLTDKLTMTTEDPIRMEMNGILGYQAGLTLDGLARDVLNAGTNVIYSGTGNVATGDIAAGDVVTIANVRSAELTLKNNNALLMTSFVDPSTGISTVPLPPCFIGITHVNLSNTFRAMTGFVKVELYSNGSGRMDGEIGKVESTRILETTNAKVFLAAGTGGIDVYTTIIMAQYAYATTAISGHALENIVKPLGSAGAADPLNQRETSGWKASFVAIILNDDFLVRIESAMV